MKQTTTTKSKVKKPVFDLKAENERTLEMLKIFEETFKTSTTIQTIDVTPSWSRLLPFLIRVCSSSQQWEEKYKIADAELKNMARVADECNEMKKGENGKPPQEDRPSSAIKRMLTVY